MGSRLPKAFAAQRHIVLECADGSTRDILVRVGKPRRGRKDWVCVIEVFGFQSKLSRKIYGVDSFQALLLAIELLRAELNHQKRAENGKLKWLGQDDLGLWEKKTSKRQSSRPG
jgi:hypothetical protein